MTHDPLTLIALIHRLAAIDRYALERVSQLLYVRETQASALLHVADGRAMTVDQLAAELDMSHGGVRAFVQSMRRANLLRYEPAPDHRPGVAVRLSPGAANELAAALAPLTDRLQAMSHDPALVDRS